MDLYQKIKTAGNFLKNRFKEQALTAIVTGTGLEKLADDVEDAIVIPYGDIPHFPRPTVESHKGQMLIGRIAGRAVVVMQGRFHYYEGYAMQEVTFPVRVMKEIGIQQLIITNATGALDPSLRAGDIVLINDHINLQPENPLRGLNDSRLGERFPAMGNVYDKELLVLTEAAMASLEMPSRQGVYVGLQGPNLETPAEYRYLRIIGGDVVGMSSVPEVIVAAQCQLPVLGLSVCTNSLQEDEAHTTIQDVLDVAHIAGEQLRKIIVQLLPTLP